MSGSTTTPKEDLNGALDALERRAAHLSALVYPEPGTRPARSAHWRDEVELKALRTGIKAIREKQSRSSKEEDILVNASSAVDLLERIVAEGRLSARLLAEARSVIAKLDDAIEAAE